MPNLKPRQPVPSFVVPTLDHGTFDLSAQQPEHFTLIVVYRGLHCPVCRNYTKELADLVPEFTARGVTVLGVSTDEEARARKAYEEWKLDGLQLGYALPVETARNWGLFITSAEPGSQAPSQFAEPGVFVVRPDGSLYASIINTMPFARPHLKDVLSALEFVIKKDYPARGES